MKTTSALFIAACALMPGVAISGVTVTFSQPEKYTDMPFGFHDKKEVMDVLQQHFDKLGKTLPLGQDLKVEVLDIDLAGRIEPHARAARDLRILRGRADWPVIALKYSLESQGQVLKSGEDRVADTSYMLGYNNYNSGENLRYEKRMLDRWFKKTLVDNKSTAPARY